jgi:PASTA domain-containing protein
MALRLAALIPRFALLTVTSLLAAASPSLASATNGKEEDASTQTLLVPDVRRQPYVLAKGILEDAGFSWQVTGRIKGYATNIVAAQRPSPGTRISSLGHPTILLGLERNPDYEEHGMPQNESAYEGEQVAVPPTLTPEVAKPKAKPAHKPATREAEFQVPGAPDEPLDEMPLPDRARMVGEKLRNASHPTNVLIDWWLYQHAWVVTGARFGWSDGADAIRIMIRVDRELEQRWGFGAKSEAVARKALAEVRRLSHA